MSVLIDLEQYWNSGYSLLNIQLDDRLINDALSELTGLYKYNSDNYNENNRIQNAWRYSDAVRSIACLDDVLKVCESVFGKPAFPFQTLNFEFGSQQRPHSDYVHFASSNVNGMCGVWFALEDVTLENGPLVVYPGSHKLPSFWPEDLGLPASPKSNPYAHYSDYEDAIKNIINDYDLRPELICLKKGQGLIWHSNLLHGGSRISNTNLSRKSQVTHYFATREVYFTPLTSSRSFSGRKYRMPIDVLRSRRGYTHISLLKLIKTLVD